MSSYTRKKRRLFLLGVRDIELGVPKLSAGTGEQIFNTVDTMQQWNVTNKVQAMSFDTTDSNTGAKMGACTLFEAGRDLLCVKRHVAFVK
ncbi:unnamed protein product [Arctia plantaginis]|uniref:Uncharacterized protein n=1 Tax=Arctia plantaginis TaxID=874455 RepID=A0A8S0ZV87_ARCPL|nr:unnamed protein product [Arctia plantaginis]